MAEQDNLVLHLLREMREDLSAVKVRQERDSAKLTNIDRRMLDLHDSMVTAMGTAMHAQVTTENYGHRFDELTDELAALKRRVQALEGGR